MTKSELQRLVDELCPHWDYENQNPDCDCRERISRGECP
jgi:hypothetical protein